MVVSNNNACSRYGASSSDIEHKYHSVPVDEAFYSEEGSKREAGSSITFTNLHSKNDRGGRIASQNVKIHLEHADETHINKNRILPAVRNRLRYKSMYRRAFLAYR